ncbi:MAG: aminotransferase class IV [Polyangia bacterium]|jgi:branched-subunit amino acid aminotransferase/4-amino-4-deoxychorismate lyase|nr:aminotransferase class IV [Polyangia bacterium]
MLVYLNGSFVPEEAARVSALDQGLLAGIGAFETLRAYGGRFFRLSAHLDRLAATLRWLGIFTPVAALGEAASTLLGRQRILEARVRITVTAGGEPRPTDGKGHPTVLVTAGPLNAPPPRAYLEGIAAIRCELPHGLGGGAGHKVTSYLGWTLARRAALEAGAGEALLVTGGGELVEGAHSNLFVVVDGEVLTPPLSTGALPGVTRAAILGLLKSEGLPWGERRIHWVDIERAREIFVTSSIVEVLPVTALGGARVGDGAPGGLTRRLAAAYRALVTQEIESSRAGA